MPPKGARSRGATRGRGRGRGKAVAPAPAPAEEFSAPAILPGQTVADHRSGSAVAASASSNVPAPIVTTPQNLLNEDVNPSPNSSPATIPTETPAPTPARAPAAQSDPFNYNAPHTGPLAFPTMDGRGGRGGARGGAANPPAPSRFKPKNVRRDASELEEIARKEHDRLAAIAAENVREASRQARGRGRPLRGRGDAMGRGGSGRKTTASGTFGIAPEALRTATGGIMTFKREGGGSGDGGVSRGAAGAVGGFNMKRGGGGGSYSGPSGSGGANERDWVPEPQYPHEDDDVMKVDIEQINLVSDDEDDEPQYLGSNSKHSGNGRVAARKGLRPVRLMREEHKERVLLVNTEAPTKPPPDSDDELQAVDELRSSSKAAQKANEFKGVYQDPDAVRIKDEPRATPEPTVQEVKSSPDSRRKKQDAFVSSVPLSIDPISGGEVFTTAQKDHKARRPSKKQDKKPVIQTEEDRAEYYRHLNDVEILTKELIGLQSVPSKGKGRDVEGNIVMDGTAAPAEEEEQKQGNGRLYLFQFPPVLPELYNPKDPKPRNPVLVKREEEEAAARAKEEVEALGSINVKGKGKVKDRPDLTGEPAPLIKKEEEGVETAAEKMRREEEERKKKRGKLEIVHEEGYVGKLVVRKSGRVELIWGGTDMLVGRGIETSFLQTGVIVDSVERGPPGGGVPEGKAIGMGQIMGKFVVTPDWENY